MPVPQELNFPVGWASSLPKKYNLDARQLILFCAKPAPQDLIPQIRDCRKPSVCLQPTQLYC